VQLAELRDHLLAEEVDACIEQLPELHEGRSELLEGAPQADGDARVPVAVQGIMWVTKRSNPSAVTGPAPKSTVPSNLPTT